MLGANVAMFDFFILLMTLDFAAYCKTVEKKQRAFQEELTMRLEGKYGILNR